MSQAGEVNTAAGPVPPSVATSYVTDINSPAIPALNVLDVFGGTVTTNNNNGVQTDGSSGSNVLTVELTNRITGTGTTTDAVTPVTIFTFPLGATPGTYMFTQNLVAYNVTDALSAGFTSFATVRTTGAAASLIGSNTPLDSEEGTMSGLGIQTLVSIAGNSYSVTVEGLAAKTIHYRALTTYLFVS